MKHIITLLLFLSLGACVTTKPKRQAHKPPPQNPTRQVAEDLSRYAPPVDRDKIESNCNIDNFRDDIYIKSRDELKVNKCNLQGADFENAYMPGVHIRWSNFRGANLQGADFRGADLTASDFTGANLKGADFRGADLDRAILVRANLEDTDFRGSSFFSHANFKDAIIKNTDFRGADLRSVKFLTKDDLKNAKIEGADFRDTTQPLKQIEIPEEESPFNNHSNPAP